MTPEQGRAFLLALGGKPEQYSGGGWIKCPCLLAPYTHKNGKDNNPSFGLSVGEAKVSKFNCFTCRSGSPEELLQTLEHYSGGSPQYNFAAARAMLQQETVDVFPLAPFAEFQHDITQEFFEWPAWFVDTYPEAWDNQAAMDYLTKRGVSVAEAFFFDLRWDHTRNMVCFPFRNVHGKLAGMRGRCIYPEGQQHYDYTWNKVNNTGLVWYNEQVLNAEKPVIVVEGQFDCLRVQRVYPYSLANLTAKAMYAKVKKLVQAPGVILMLDNDKTGQDAIARYEEYFKLFNIPYQIVFPSEDAKDPDAWGETAIAEALKEIGLLDETV